MILAAAAHSRHAHPVSVVARAFEAEGCRWTSQVLVSEGPSHGNYIEIQKRLAADGCVGACNVWRRAIGRDRLLSRCALRAPRGEPQVHVEEWQAPSRYARARKLKRPA